MTVIGKELLLTSEIKGVIPNLKIAFISFETLAKGNVNLNFSCPWHLKRGLCVHMPFRVVEKGFVIGLGYLDRLMFVPNSLIPLHDTHL